MADKIKQRQTIPIYCPECTGKTNKMPHMLCMTDDSGDIIIRCRCCKSDINISALLRNTG